MRSVEHVALRRTILKQGGRYTGERLRYLMQTLRVPTQPCRAPGCHGIEGVCPAEWHKARLGPHQLAPFLVGIERLHPGDFPCAVCGSTGFIPTTVTIEEQVE